MFKGDNQCWSLKAMGWAGRFLQSVIINENNSAKERKLLCVVGLRGSKTVCCISKAYIHNIMHLLKLPMSAYNAPPSEPALPKPRQGSQIAAYENSEEVTNLEDLDELISDPDDMRMQALLVRERILGPAHPDTSYYIRP
jgi:hypothetical protein